MSRGDTYQISLIALGVAATVLAGSFVYREAFPEYKIYQKDYVALEDFRSTYTGEPPPDFSIGIKQIVLLREDKGPPVIDRCTSCHVALQFEHFSPTKIVYGDDGKPTVDEKGFPVKIPNENYVWARLDQEIARLKENGQSSEAEKYEVLKTAHVGDHVYDVTKALQMHPLMGKETRPFEFHPIDEYGCVSCHNGNGRALTTEKAHGPVYDGQYEAEDTGYAPSFLEKDPEHDPPFSKVFNHKPGHELLFQTNPLFVGALIQAKCMQCHQSSVGVIMGNVEIDNTRTTSPHVSNQFNAIDLLTQNFQRGQSLFISQACYACHRIAGLARGGIGPELTHEGLAYPWFVKESIVWPQADLKTSTMPNYKMDHRELEDILTFILAQTGENKAVSPIEYRSAIQAWESGKKLPWEKNITPNTIFDLNHAMTIFATEGCAACHRLKGFTSDVGFAVEKGASVPLETLYKEKEWFRRLVPEMILGSELIAVMEQHGDEIDKKILSNVHQEAILNAIEKQSPETIESFYSNFRFASRAKDEAGWKERLHRVLMMYIQEYGLGRLIGPRPNWSGVYRSDEWLMEHFKNPSSAVPRSIMPVFPFDETKFYSLTYMLDVLGIRNRNEEQAIRKIEGFNPAEAYQTHCAQCHGENRQGNGPVSEWIYPIPKNLRNSDFLHHLTRERAIQSIVHGVKGTPMAPWGEASDDKPLGLSEGAPVPVLSIDNIEKIVDWLFSELPGGEVWRGKDSISKWQYTIEDVSNELQKEGNSGKLQKGETEIFDLSPPPVHGPDKYGYYIKKKFYTPENILAGQTFFELNCAQCHGRDGDGAGPRASAMVEAKPRMLTNLEWINSKDDLSLIRSLKYGVPGTSMTPWGDQTNSLQRLQLVMFIRSLTEGRKERKILDDAIYDIFDRADQELERLRGEEYVEIAAAEQRLTDLQIEKQSLYSKVTTVGETPATLVALIEQELPLLRQVNLLKEKDASLLELKNLIKKERELFLGMGITLLQLHPEEEILTKYIEYVRGYAPLLGQNKALELIIAQATFKEQSRRSYQDLLEWLESKITFLQEEEIRIEGMIGSQEKSEQAANLKTRIVAYKKGKEKLISTDQQGEKLLIQQKDLVNTYNAKIKP